MDINGPIRRFLFAISLTSAACTVNAAECEFSGLDSTYTSADAPVRLSGTPSGGVFSGPGVTGNNFDPAAAGPGTHTITYTDTSDYSVSRSGRFDPVATNSGWTDVPSRSGGRLAEVDDGISSAIAIGFDFQFFGNRYNELYISSNGDVAFEPYDASRWQSTVMPRSSAPNNLIALVRTDLKPDSPVKSSIRYRTDGREPNRVFIVDFSYTDPRSENASGFRESPEVVTQLKLFESTQSIEIHTRHNGAYWQNSVQGIENADGSVARYVRGRNFGFWDDRTDDFVAFEGCSFSRTVTVDGAYTLGGEVRGFQQNDSGTNSVVLTNSDGQQVTVTDNGRFRFASALEADAAYEVQVAQQPQSPAQTCEITGGRGEVEAAPVTNILVDCDTGTHSLQYSAGPNGRIIGRSEQTVEDGHSGREVRAEPDDGYVFSGWSDGSTQNPRRDTAVTASLSVTAEFVLASSGEQPDSPEDGRAPEISAAAESEIHAAGLLTEVPASARPTAEDNVDGELAVALQSGRPLLRPGRHQLTWIAEDSAGNRAEHHQTLDVHPIVSLGVDQERAEGTRAAIVFLLNGPAPEYPLTVGYSVSGSATAEDHDLQSGTVQFNQGEREKVLRVTLSADQVSDDGETLVVALNPETTSTGAANFGIQREQTITIRENALKPSIALEAFQDGERTMRISRDGGPVTLAVTSTVFPDETLGEESGVSIDWRVPVQLEEIDNATQQFDPAQLETGLHTFTVVAFNDEPGSPSSRVQKSLLFEEGSPQLESSADSDSDGLADLEEGTGDANGNGLSDYLEPTEQANVISADAGDGFLFLVETNPGLSFELGNLSLRYGADGVRLTQAELAEDADSTLGADAIKNTGGYADFVIRGLRAGGAAEVVIPQQQAIPENAAYRKYLNGAWTSFEEGPSDGVASAAGAEGACPPPGSDQYQEGLTTGHWCVQLTLSDGGPNDADGEANGVIVDPGGAGAAEGTSALTTEGGGGAVSALAIILMSVVGLARRFRGAIFQHLRVRNCRGRKRGATTAAAYALALLGTASSVLAPLAFPAQSRAQELLSSYHPLYLTANTGWADSKVSASEIDRRFEDAGYTVETHAVDASRLAWNFGLGYRATKRLAVEASYTNLGEVKLDFETEIPTSGLADIYPRSGHGGTLSAVYRHPVSQRWGVSARLGIFVWEGDYATYSDALRFGESKGRNDDIYYGAGVDYLLSPAWSLNAELQRYEFQADPTHWLAVGAKFRWLEWWDRR